MEDSMNRLIELQEIDTAIRERRNERDRFPELLKALEERRQANKAGVEQVREALQTAQKNKRDRDRDLETGAQKVEKLKSRTTEIKTNKEYQALLKEIELAEQENKAVEDDILVLMEKIDAASSQIAGAETQAREQEAAIKAETAQLEAARTKLDAELTAREEERGRVAAGIDPQLLNRYQKLAAITGGRAVVEAWNESCSGCRMKIQPQLFVNIKKGEGINTCPYCHRILYYKEAIAPRV